VRAIDSDPASRKNQGKEPIIIHFAQKRRRLHARIPFKEKKKGSNRSHPPEKALKRGKRGKRRRSLIDLIRKGEKGGVSRLGEGVAVLFQVGIPRKGMKGRKKKTLSHAERKKRAEHQHVHPGKAEKGARGNLLSRGLPSVKLEREKK